MTEKITVREISPWGIGQKVICVTDEFRTAPPHIRAANAFPVAGQTYTIRDVHDERSPEGTVIRTSFHLEEIVNEPMRWPQHGNTQSEISFLDTNFKAEPHFTEFLKVIADLKRKEREKQFYLENPMVTRGMMKELAAQINRERQ